MTDRPTPAQLDLADRAVAFARSARVRDLVSACRMPQPLIARDAAGDARLRRTAQGFAHDLMQAAAEFIARNDSDLCGALRWEHGWERIRAAEETLAVLRETIG